MFNRKRHGNMLSLMPYLIGFYKKYTPIQYVKMFDDLICVFWSQNWGTKILLFWLLVQKKQAIIA